MLLRPVAKLPTEHREVSQGSSQLHLTHAGDVARRGQKSSCSGLHKTAFQTVLPGTPPAHYMVAGKAADPDAEAFADFVSQMMSFNGGENKDRQQPPSCCQIGTVPSR